jgi:hypothetical protein
MAKRNISLFMGATQPGRCITIRFSVLIGWKEENN